MGILITLAILRIVWDSGKTVFSRLIDGVDPEVIDEIERAVKDAQGVQEVTDVRVRWLGHRLHAELNLAVSTDISVREGHAIAVEARHRLLHALNYVCNATIHIDPTDASGEEHHRIPEHAHDRLAAHSH